MLIFTHIIETESRNGVVNTPTSLLGGPGFKSRLGDRYANRGFS
jgi:hypothetical protein